MALPRPLAPPTGLSAAAKRALVGPGGAGTGRGGGPAALPAPTAKVCQINSSPRNCPGRGSRSRSPPPRRPNGSSQAGRLQRKGKSRGALRGQRSCGTGPGERMRPGVNPPAEIAQLVPWSPGPAVGKGSLLLSEWSGRLWVTGAAQSGPGQEHPRTEGHPIAGHRPGALPAPPRRRQALTRLLPYNGERNLRSPLNCCKTSPGRFTGLGRRWRSAAPRAPSPPAAPAGPTPPARR